MECASCHRENPADSRFCSACGQPLSLNCAGCGRSNPGDAAFCNGCGGALGAQPASADPTPTPSPASPASPEPGVVADSTFGGGRYRIEAQIGEGARKRVYRARDTLLGRAVALGVIKTGGLDADERVRVRREAQSMAQLGDHANIVTVHDIGEERGEIFVVSQLMDGDLDDRLAGSPNRRLPIDEVLRLAAEIADGLDHAHRSGIVHRDLKPGNVFVSKSGRPALADFGLAVSSHQSRVTQEGMMVGTVAYMAPEQALGGETDARSDLYGLGATLYELVTGRPPFQGDDVVAIISQHMNTPPVSPSWQRDDVPAALDELILSLLAKSPDDRPASARVVADQLARIEPGASRVEPDREEAPNPLEGLSRGVFVGREVELKTLRSRIDEVFSRSGRVLLLQGEPGIGKTRTAEEITTYAKLRGAQVLWGRCHEGDGAPAYWPWIQLIREHVRERDAATLLSELGAGASAIAEIVSEVSERLPGLQPAPALDSQEARFRLNDSLALFLQNVARQKPLVVVLDDLHWADKPSLVLLQHLSHHMAGSSLLVLATYRDVELRRTHPLAETLADLARLPDTERIALRGLTEADVSRFIELSAGREAPGALAQAVYRETEGNPFFVHEVVRLLVDEGRLEDAEKVASWSLTIPQGIRDVIGRRLNRLSDECNELLAVASVLGREFEMEVLGGVGDRDEGAVERALEEAVSAHVLDESADVVGRHRFAHALIRETLYEELSTTRRVKLHRRVFEVLEKRYAVDPEPHLAELAYHASEGAHGGGDVERAITYSRRAAARARDLHAFEEAALYFERALQAFELRAADEAPAERFDVLCELSIASGYAGDLARARAAADEAIEIARALADPKRAVVAVCAAGDASRVPEELSRLTGIVERALEDIGDEVCVERVRALRWLAVSRMTDGRGKADSEAASRLAEESVAVARETGDPMALFLSLEGLYLCCQRPDRLEERAVVAAELDSLPERLGQQGFTTYRGMADALERGDGPGYRQQVGEMVEHARKNPTLPAAGVHSRSGQATIALLEADWEAAVPLINGAYTYGARFGGWATAHFAVQRAALGRAQMTIDAESLEALEAMISQSGMQHPAWDASFALFYATLDRHEDAIAKVQQYTRNGLDGLPFDLTWLGALASLAEACWATRESVPDLESASLLYRELLPFAGRVVSQANGGYIAGSTSHHLGCLATMLARFDEAASHFEESLAILERLGERYWRAESQNALAAMRVLRDEPGDREAALDLLNEVIRFSRETETKRTLEAALTQKLSLQGVDPSPSGGTIGAVTLAAQRSLPNLSLHTGDDGTVTLMFSDMEGFTAMTERLGDHAAREVIRQHNRIVREQLALHHGLEVELQGDGFLLAFASPSDGLSCAIALQRAFLAHNDSSDEPIRVRIGLHTGEVLRDADKFFGRTVILASRIADQARGGEILVSTTARDRVANPVGAHFDGERSITLKGFAEPQRVCEVHWGDAER